MTTEQPTAPATPPAGFDTLAEMTKLRDAGVPEAHAVAMLYAGIAAADARFAEVQREIRDAKKDLQQEVRDAKRETETAKKDLQRDIEDAKRETGTAKKDVTLRLGVWVLAVATLSVGAVGIIVHWPG